MKTFHLHRKTILPISLQDAWDFFSNPANLARITPPDMGFVIRSGADKPMHTGQLITYTVRPVLGIPVKWVTRITGVEQLKQFTDEQEKGPYKLWRHTHTFNPVDGGVEMTDHVEYALPFGIIGVIAHRLFIRSRLNQIFNYRQKVMDDIFPEGNSIPSQAYTG